MPIYALGDKAPVIHPDAFVHPDAVVIGDVTIGANSSVWPGAVLRGDDGYITVGERTSIQDGTVVHTTPFTPTVVGDGCERCRILQCPGHVRRVSADDAAGLGLPRRGHLGRVDMPQAVAGHDRACDRP